MQNACKCTTTVLRTLVAVALVGVAAYLGGCSTTQPKEQVAKSDAESVEQISEVRRALRAACGKLKEVNAGAADKAALMADARDLTAHAVQDWSCFLQDWGGSAPAGYAMHPDWNAATRELSAGMSEMLKRIEENDAADAFNACGAVCGKFVALNEQAGVRRTSDVLFRFRKTAKPLAQPVAEKDLEGIRPVIEKLLQLRDRALTDPVGGASDPVAKEQALRVFSAAVDAFSSAVSSGTNERLAVLYEEMMASMEAAYDLYL